MTEPRFVGKKWRLLKFLDAIYVKSINTAWAKIVYLIAQSAVNLRISVLPALSLVILQINMKLILVLNVHLSLL